MRQDFFWLLVLLLSVSPAFALSISPTQQEIQFNPFLVGAGRFSISTENPATCEFFHSDATSQYTFTEPSKDNPEVSFTVKISKLPFNDILQVSCIEQQFTVSQIITLSGNVVSQDAGMPNQTIVFFNSYSKPSPPQFDPKELQYIDYPYFGFIGTGIGLDWILASIVALLVVGVLWKGVDS